MGLAYEQKLSFREVKESVSISTEALLCRIINQYTKSILILLFTVWNIKAHEALNTLNQHVQMMYLAQVKVICRRMQTTPAETVKCFLC